MKSLIFLGALVLMACSEFPRDPESTLERVRAERRFRVGVIAGLDERSERTRTFLAGVSGAAGARAVIESGAADPLLKKLERGALDVVIGPMSAKSPWQKHVHFLPLDEEKPVPPDHLHNTAVARNGENAWISLLHREAASMSRR